MSSSFLICIPCSICLDRSWSSLLILNIPLSTLSRESLESLLSRSGFFIDRFKTGGAPWGISSLLGTKEETPLDEDGPEDDAEVADPVDSHSKESVPESPRLLEMYSLFFGTNRTDPATELRPSILSASEGKSFAFESPGDRDMARLPSLRLFMGLCSDSLISSGSGEERLLSEEDLALSRSSIISWSARLTASGTASLPDSLRGRPRLRFGPRKLGDGRLEWWREEVEVVRCLFRELSGERSPPVVG